METELRSQNRLLRWMLLVQTALLVAIGVASCVSLHSTAAPPPPAQALTVRELNVVDDHGVVRVRVSGKLPEPIVGGKTFKRGTTDAGVMLYDSDGQERGGYVTENESKNILLTFDGKERQTTFLVANPDGATALRIWRGDDAIALRADEDGARLEAVRDKQLVMQDPPLVNPEKTAACAAYREARGKVSDKELLGFCRERMTEAGCRACLGLD